MVPTTVSRVFPDISDLGRAAGFDLGFRQLDTGPGSVKADLLPGEQVVLVRLTLGRAYHQLGSPPPGMKSFGIPFLPMRSWCGHRYEENSVLPFNLPGGLDGVSESGMEACTLSVSEDSLRSVSETFQVPVGEVLTAARSDSVIANGRATQLFRRLIAQAFENMDSPFAREREDEIVFALLHAALTDVALADRSSPASRSRAVSKAIAFVNDRQGEAVTVSDICRETGVAARTLNRGFRERFGVGPKAYLIRQRLSGARADLVRAPSGTVISDVANHWGFWHMGQFARDYRALFGELPSETAPRG